MTFIDFCSGIGGGRLGLEKAGFATLAHSEISKRAEKVYNLLFNERGGETNLGDLTRIDSNAIPKTDLILAGFPCQTFSILGKRAGFFDTRGQVIFSLINILHETKTPYFIFENVKGLVNHNKGETLKSVLNLLTSAGYRVFHKVLNSKDYGLPQARERVYFVGIREDLSRKKQFEFPCIHKRVSFSSIINIFQNDDELDLEHPTFKKYLNNKYNMGRVDIERILDKDYLVVDTRQSDLRVYDNISPTLRFGRNGLLYVKNHKLYRLSAEEALLLQGFPVEYIRKTSGVPKNTLLSLAGNAMSVNVIEELGKALRDYAKS